MSGRARITHANAIGGAVILALSVLVVAAGTAAAQSDERTPPPDTATPSDAPAIGWPILRRVLTAPPFFAAPAEAAPEPATTAPSATAVPTEAPAQNVLTPATPNVPRPVLVAPPATVVPIRPRPPVARPVTPPLVVQAVPPAPPCSPLAIRDAHAHHVTPNLVGCAYDGVAPLVQEFFGVNPTRQDGSDSSAVGIIYAQDPPAGQPIADQTPFSLSVSSGPQPSPSPAPLPTNDARPSPAPAAVPSNVTGNPATPSLYIVVLIALAGIAGVAALVILLRKPPKVPTGSVPLPNLCATFDAGSSHLSVDGPLLDGPKLEVGVTFEMGPATTITIVGQP